MTYEPSFPVSPTENPLGKRVTFQDFAYTATGPMEPQRFGEDEEAYEGEYLHARMEEAGRILGFPPQDRRLAPFKKLFSTLAEEGRLGIPKAYIAIWELENNAGRMVSYKAFASRHNAIYTRDFDAYDAWCAATEEEKNAHPEQFYHAFDSVHERLTRAAEALGFDPDDPRLHSWKARICWYQEDLPSHVLEYFPISRVWCGILDKINEPPEPIRSR